jgi:hypothetical protein
MRYPQKKRVLLDERIRFFCFSSTLPKSLYSLQNFWVREGKESALQRAARMVVGKIFKLVKCPNLGVQISVWTIASGKDDYL